MVNPAHGPKMSAQKDATNAGAVPLVRLGPGDFEAWFELGEVLGSGAYGQVWSARDLGTGRWVALKTFARTVGRDDPWARHSLLQKIWAEVALVEQLQARDPDANLPYVYLVVEEDAGERRRFHLVMELLPGVDLSRLAEQHREAGTFLRQTAFWSLAYQALSALHRLHCAGIAHRDVKPANLMALPTTLGERRSELATYDGEPLLPEAMPGDDLSPALVLMDFGLSCLFDPARSGAGLRGRPGDYWCPPRVIGTAVFAPAWLRDADLADMSPAMRGEFLQGADLFSLGASLFEVLEQESPHGYETAGTKTRYFENVRERRRSPYVFADGPQQAFLDRLLDLAPEPGRAEAVRLELLDMAAAQLARRGINVPVPAPCQARPGQKSQQGEQEVTGANE